MQARPVILVVEDDSNDAILLGLAFNKAQASAAVHFVKGGEEAILYLQGKGPYANRALFPVPTLIVVDLKLSGMSGLEFLAWVHRQPFIDGVRVGVLSSAQSEREIQAARALGAQFLMAKPCSFEELVAIAGELNRESFAGAYDLHALAATPVAEESRVDFNFLSGW